MSTDAAAIGGMGHSVKRKEDARFLRGKGRYIDDIKLPGMVYMDIVRSPYAHANIKSIDASKALALPGVLAVITGKDLDAAGLARSACDEWRKREPLAVLDPVNTSPKILRACPAPKNDK